MSVHELNASVSASTSIIHFRLKVSRVRHPLLAMLHSQCVIFMNNINTVYCFVTFHDMLTTQLINQYR